MAAKIKLLSGKDRKGAVGQPLPHKVSVKVVDDVTGQAMAGYDVTFSQKNPDTLDFPGNRAYAIEQTDDEGLAETRVTPLVAGTHELYIECLTAKAKVDVTAEDTGVTTAGGLTAIAGGGQTVIVPQFQYRAPAPVAGPPRVIIVNNC